MDIYEIIRRAQVLSGKTEVASIAPPEVGGLIGDLASVVNENNINGIRLSIKQTYESVDAMTSALSPVDYDGNPLQKGSLVIISSTTAGDENNNIYSYRQPGWEYVTKLYNEKYIPIALWSGEIYDDASVEPMSYPQQDEANIVFVKSKNTFAYKVVSGFTTTFYNNWGIDSRELYQKNVYVGVSFIPDYTNAIFVGLNGCIMKAKDEQTMIVLAGKNEFATLKSEIVTDVTLDPTTGRLTITKGFDE